MLQQVTERLVVGEAKDKGQNEVHTSRSHALGVDKRATGGRTVPRRPRQSGDEAKSSELHVSEKEGCFLSYFIMGGE